MEASGQLPSLDSPKSGPGPPCFNNNLQVDKVILRYTEVKSEFGYYTAQLKLPACRISANSR